MVDAVRTTHTVESGSPCAALPHYIVAVDFKHLRLIFYCGPGGIWVCVGSGRHFLVYTVHKSSSLSVSHGLVYSLNVLRGLQLYWRVICGTQVCFYTIQSTRALSQYKQTVSILI